MREKIRQLLVELRMKGMEKALDEELDRLEEEGGAPEEPLYRLLVRERAWRRQRSMVYRLDQAKIPFAWTLKTFPFDRQP